MLRWLRRRKRDTEGPIATALGDAPVLELAQAVGAAALSATIPIKKAWSEVTGEEPMSPKSDFVVRMEAVWFFLHVVNRTAFAQGGDEARAFVQDAIAEIVVQAAVTSSFDISTAKKGFDAEQWQQRMIRNGIEALSESELDYGSCKALLFDDSSGTRNLLDESCVVGRFAARVAEAVHQKDNTGLWLLVGGAAMEAMTEVELPKLVRRATEATR